MSDASKIAIPKSDVPKKAGCCGGDHDKDNKHQAAPPIPLGKAKPADRGSHEHAADADGGCCGSVKTGK